ncbi:transcription factor PAP1-domain-containing protein [Dipodascopsis uninucleata]
MSSSFQGDYFTDDTSNFLAALSSSEFLGDFSSLQNASAAGATSGSPATAPNTTIGTSTLNNNDYVPLDFQVNLSPNEINNQIPGYFVMDPEEKRNAYFNGYTKGDSRSGLNADSFKTEENTPSLTSKTSISSSETASPEEKKDTPQSSKLDQEKRKVDDDYSDDDFSETESKRRDTNTAEPDDAKKRPGRKLMTSEPSSKRKAQNRAAQRAFRERKEKHLRDLEARVAELENDAHSMTTENQFLKKQVDRLQNELKEYRKRQIPGNSSNKSSPNYGGNYSAPFTFEFPLFGADPKLAKAQQQQQQQQQRQQSHQSSNKQALSKSNSISSPGSQTLVGGNLLPSYSPASIVSLQSPASSTSSPNIASNVINANSANTPNSKSACAARSVNGAYSNEEDDFCAQLSMACGTRENPIPKAKTGGVLSPPSFDSELFTDYRDPIFNTGDEDFNLPELTPDEVFDNNGVTAKNDEVVPADNKVMMSCTALWDRISMHPKFGDLDIEGLCSELRTKAKCSESGVVVTESDLNDVLEKIK